MSALIQLAQLYVPIAGLLVLAFWTGGLSQRVKALEREIKTWEDGNGNGGILERMIRVEIAFEGIGAQLTQLNRGQDNIRATIANLVSGRADRAVEV